MASVLALLGAACLRAPAVEVACDPGGACGTPLGDRGVIAARLGLPDLATAVVPVGHREVRIWWLPVSGRGGRLRRLFADSAGRSAAVEVDWWPTADSLDGRQRAGACEPVASGAGIQLCVADSVGAPYAANRLGTLARRGVWTLPGDATPPDTACHHICNAPGWLVVEVRDGRRYRTYGYGLPSPDHATELSPQALLWAY